MTYADAMLRYGSDKPDLRFGLEIEDATESTRASEFKVFADAPAVRLLRCRRSYSRADLEKLEEFAKEWGAKGLAYIVYGEDGEPRSPIAKFLSEDELSVFRCRARVDGAVRRRSSRTMVARVLGSAPGLRLGHELGLIDEENMATSLWVTDFPMFEWDEDERPLDGEPPSVHRADPGVGADAREGSGPGARPVPTTSSERRRAGSGLDQDPRAETSGNGSSTCWTSRPKSSVRASVSSSTRSGWARRRTAGIAPGSTGR